MRRNPAFFGIAISVVAWLAVQGSWAGAVPASQGAEPSGSWLGRVQEEIRDSEYRMTWQAEPLIPGLEPSWQAPNRAHNLRTYFNENGIHVIERTAQQPGWIWGLELEAIGRGDLSIQVGAAAPVPSSNRIEYARDVITEWYVNDPRGLEQGFDLALPPERLASGPPAGPGPLFLRLALRGSLVPVPSPDGQQIDFRRADGTPVLRYSELLVLDATGRELPARMELFSLDGERGILLRVDDRDSVYPLMIDPLTSSPTWTVDGGQEFANFGQSVAPAGDVNGDQFSDVIIGAPFYDNGNTDEGVAFVYHGSPTGLPIVADWTADINQGGASFGFSVASAGDVNGDGFSDVIIGANMSSGSEDDEGRVWAYHGSATGLESTFSWTVDSDQDFAQLGHSVASAGDTNGDGYSDVVVAAPYWDNDKIDAGLVRLYRGSAGGLSAIPAWEAQGAEEGGRFGWSVAPAGDVNGDGYSDVIIGEAFADKTNTDQGRGVVYHGSQFGLPSSPNTELLVAQDAAWCGWSVASAGDVSGDGYSDVLVGCPLYDLNGDVNAGGVFLYEGSAAGVSESESWSAFGPQGNVEFGSSVSTAGDVDGNGYADVVIGAPTYSNGESLEGAAFYYASSSTGIASSFTWSAECDQALCRFGASVATAGDVNGDGFSDVLVGASQYNGAAGLDEGRALLYRGSVHGPDELASWSAESDQDDADLGYSVSGAGDTNADGFDDVIIGAPFYDNGLSQEGRILVYLGSGSGLETTANLILDGEATGARFGWSVAGVDDVNGDGFDDVAVGCPNFSNPEAAEGIAFVLFGSETGPTTPTWLAQSDQQGANFGWSVGGAGDVNGDGNADVIVGAPGFDPGAGKVGRVFVYTNLEPGPANAPDWTTDGDQVGAEFGYAVSSAGDVDGDGYSEILIGAPFYNLGLSEEGRVYAHRGSVFGPLTEPFWTKDGPSETARLGFALASAGDVDGDRFADVIIGAPLLSNGEGFEGRAFLYKGSTSGLSDSPVWTVESNQAGAKLGRAVAGAGDINGDGYAEVIIGSPFYSNGNDEVGRAQVYAGSATGLGGTAVWSVEGVGSGEQLSWSVDAAGDINGDGYGDLLVGAPNASNGEISEGRAFAYYGAGYGAFLASQQRQADDLSAIGLRGVATDTDEFRLSMFGRTPFGLGEVKLQWEVKPFGTPFDGVPSGTATAWTDTILPTDPPSSALSDPVSGLTPGRAYHWRVRLLYNPVMFPWQQHGRWVNPPRDGWEQADLRMWAAIDLAVAQSVSKDPVFEGEIFDYTVDTTNAGPDGIDATLLIELPADVDVVTIVSSQGECVDSDHVLTCYLGWLASGGSATTTVTVLPQAVGVQMNVVTAGSPAATDDPIENNTNELTNVVNEPKLGNFVWDDLNGDGIQDTAELGIANVLVAAYTPDGTLVDTAVTNSTGFFAIPALLYGSDYYLRFFPPPGYVLTAQNQGPDDQLDSDPDPFTLETPVITLVEQADRVRWDAGMFPYCVEPDEPVYISSMDITDDGNEFPILNFMDPNQPAAVTGYNIYRSDDPAPPPSTWPLIATDVVDMDEATPNQQWVDTTGDVSPTGSWFYKVSAYSNRCPAEGPL